ncbi:MAG: trypsin-like peptidase domain-containing protein [Nitrospirae bacterium]|nr:trypsin-like peptidase domain-containing protein [Nitrospirota bacterium]
MEKVESRNRFLRSFLLLGFILLPGSAFSLSPKEIYKKSAPSVVAILCYDLKGSGTAGSGFLIDEKSRVLTNAHVVIGGKGAPYEKIWVYFKPESITGNPDKDLRNPVKAKVERFDDKLDLALLSLESPPAGSSPLALADPSSVEIGDYVAAIGHPEQGGLWTLTTGTVSTVVADMEGVPGKDAFQTEASINRGNSGGPLLDENGNVIGINSLIVRQAADGLAITDVNFAIKSGVAQKWLNQGGLNVALTPKSPTSGEDPAFVRAAASKEKITTSKQPFRIETVVEAQRKKIEKEMSDMMDEMHRRVIEE